MDKVLFWDFDGTLYDSYPVILEGFMSTLNDYGIQANRREIYQILKEKSSAATAGLTWLVEDCELTITNFRAIREQAASGRLPPSKGAGLGITRALGELGVSKELYAAGQALENYYQDEYGA